MGIDKGTGQKQGASCVGRTFILLYSFVEFLLSADLDIITAEESKCWIQFHGEMDRAAVPEPLEGGARGFCHAQ